MGPSITVCGWLNSFPPLRESVVTVNKIVLTIEIRATMLDYEKTELFTLLVTVTSSRYFSGYWLKSIEISPQNF